MRKVRQLNLNLSKIDFETLAEIANLIEKTILDHISSVLGTRITDYNIVVGVKLDNDMLTITVDADTKAYFINKLSLESILDAALRNAFNAAEQFLSKFRFSEKNSGEGKKSCNSNTC